MVEVRGVEPLSENPFMQLSPGADPVQISLCRGTGTNRDIGSHFVLDRFNGERPMQVHHLHDASAETVVLLRETGGAMGRITAN